MILNVLKEVLSEDFNNRRRPQGRHTPCNADASKAQKLLNFKSTVTLENGLIELSGWAKTHGWGTIDLFEKALGELRERRLTA